MLRDADGPPHGDRRGLERTAKIGAPESTIAPYRSISVHHSGAIQASRTIVAVY